MLPTFFQRLSFKLDNYCYHHYKDAVIRESSLNMTTAIDLKEQLEVAAAANVS